MQWAALIAWIITALGGLALAFHWARHGGLRQQEGIRTPRLATHLGTAVVGLGLWIAYLASGDTVLAWLAVGMLVAVALIGFRCFCFRCEVKRTRSVPKHRQKACSRSPS
jgi:hypothetical protein